MFDCDAVRERLPLLIAEALSPDERERAHTHIESCALCAADWGATRETWRMLGEVPEVRVPSRVRERFLSEVTRLQPNVVAPTTNVVPFHRRPAARRFAQAAAIAVLVGGSFFAGQKTHAPNITSNNALSPELADNAIAVTSAPMFKIAENAVVPASAVNPNVEGNPDIENVRFFESSETAGEIGVAFDVTQHVTVKGAPNDRNMVKLLSYFLQNRDAAAASRSNAVQWVGEKYTANGVSDPELVGALANVLKNDTQEGVRIKAVEALRSLPGGAAPEVRNALVEALKNDPNPAVRIKAVEALANLAKQKTTQLDASALETLRQKASQNDENPYVRVKAAEALSSLNL